MITVGRCTTADAGAHGIARVGRQNLERNLTMHGTSVQADATSPRLHMEQQLQAIDEALGTLAVQDKHGDDYCLAQRMESPAAARAGRVIVRARLWNHHVRLTLTITSSLPQLQSPLSESQEKAIADFAHNIAEVYAA